LVTNPGGRQTPHGSEPSEPLRQIYKDKASKMIKEKVSKNNS